eukprot:3507028-Pyramimonas_sp.AAC.1
MRNLLTKARALRMHIVLMGPPGYFWTLAPIRGALDSLNLREIWLGLCHADFKYGRAKQMPVVHIYI